MEEFEHNHYLKITSITRNQLVLGDAEVIHSMKLSDSNKQGCKSCITNILFNWAKPDALLEPYFSMDNKNWRYKGSLPLGLF